MGEGLFVLFNSGKASGLCIHPTFFVLNDAPVKKTCSYLPRTRKAKFSNLPCLSGLAVYFVGYPASPISDFTSLPWLQGSKKPKMAFSLVEELRPSDTLVEWWDGGMVEWWSGDCGMLQLVRCEAWPQTEHARVQQLDSCCDAGC